MNLRLSIAASAILLAAPMPAAAQDVCGALGRIAAAAREPVPFASVSRALARGETVDPGFRPDDCRVAAGELSCGVHDFTANHFDGWPDPLPCSGLAPASFSPHRPGRDRQHAYALSGVHIEYGISCMGCAGGANSFFSAGVPAHRRTEG